MIDVLVDRESEKPLYAQIRDALSLAIEERSIKPGDQLPTVAAFAGRVGVTQCTVRRAYEDLTKSGVVSCQVGRGTFVNDPDEDAGKQSDKPKTQESYRPALDPETRDAVRRVRRGIARSLDNLLAFHNRPGLIRLTSGVPGASTLRPNVLEDLTRQAFELVGTSYSNTGDPRGMPGLRRALAERMRARGLDVSEDQILITNGSQQAMMVTAMAALEDKKRVICETPCYTGIPNAFNSLGHWVESIPRDREGPLPDRLDRFRDGRESLLYLVPEMHNPMGTDLSPGRRRLLLDWAASQNGLIIADEIFHDLRIEGRSPVSIFKDAGPERTVMIGSLSKSFASGLRIGWLVSDAERVRSLAALKRSVDLGGPQLMQGVALALFQSGEYEEHLGRVKEIYRQRRDAILEEFEEHMPEGVSWTVPPGGFNMWVELPAGYSSIVLFLLAVERGVSFVPGPYMDIDHRFVNAFRISFGDIEMEMIREGIPALASAVRELFRERPGDSGLSGLGDFI